MRNTVYFNIIFKEHGPDEDRGPVLEYHTSANRIEAADGEAMNRRVYLDECDSYIIARHVMEWMIEVATYEMVKA